MKALEPACVAKRRRVAAEISSINFKAEQLQPVLETKHRNVAAAVRKTRWAVGQTASKPPQREGVEAGDHQLPVRNQDPLDLAQDLVRIVVKLKDMRQDDQVDAVCGERQFAQIANDVDLAGFTGDLAQRDTVVGKQIDFRQTELERVVAEQIDHEGIDPLHLPVHDIASLRCLEPVIDSGI